MLFRMRVIRRLLCVVGVGIFAVGVCCAARSGCEGDIAVFVDAVAVLVAIFGVPGIGVLGYRSPGILEFWDIVVLDTGFLGILLDGNR